MSDSKTTTPFLSNRSYNALKWVAQIFLPALGAFYFSLSEIWNLPYGVEVVGTITVLDTFLGVLLQISTKSYNKSDAKFDGVLDVEEGEESKLYSLNLHSDPDELEYRNEVLFKVNKPH